jgi:hypothetical protein
MLEKLGNWAYRVGSLSTSLGEGKNAPSLLDLGSNTVYVTCRIPKCKGMIKLVHILATHELRNREAIEELRPFREITFKAVPCSATPELVIVARIEMTQEL